MPRQVALTVTLGQVVNRIKRGDDCFYFNIKKWRKDIFSQLV